MKFGVNLLLLVLCSSVVFAAPVIDDVQGVFVDGQSVVVDGSGFGIKIPAPPLLWNDFENGDDGDLVTGTSYVASNGVYASGRGWAGSKSAYFPEVGYGSPVDAYNGLGYFFSASDSGFASVKMKYVGDVYNPNMKMFRLGSYNASCGDAISHDYPFLDYSITDYDTNENIRLLSGEAGVPYPTTVLGQITSGEWMNVQEWMRMSDDNVYNGVVGARFNGLSNQLNDAKTWTTVNVRSDIPCHDWGVGRSVVANYYRETNRDTGEPLHASLDVDDYYVDNTFARVEIHDGSDFYDSDVEMQIPSYWSDNQVRVTLNQGALLPDNTYYLFVVDADGVVSNPFPISFSSEPVTEPTIYGVSDNTLSDGQSITISGAGFGVKQQALPLLYDDFEDGVPGNNITSVKVGNPIIQDRPTPQYSDVYAHSGAIGTYASGVGGFHSNFIQNMDPDDKKFYWSFWFRYSLDCVLDSGTDCNGQSKVVQLWGDYPWDNDYSPGVFVGANYNWWFAFYVTDGGVHDRLTLSFYEPDNWHHVELILEQSDVSVNNGNIYIRMDSEEVFSRENIVTTDVEGQFWDQAIFFYGFTNFGDHFVENMLDDIYFDNSWSRVEIGNALLYEDCTETVAQLPISWSDDTIQVEANLGSFSVTDDLYLFVVDEGGVVSDGFGPLRFDEFVPPPVTCGNGFLDVGEACDASLFPSSSAPACPAGSCGVQSCSSSCSLSTSTCTGYPVGDFDESCAVDLGDVSAVSSLRDLVILGRALLS